MGENRRDLCVVAAWWRLHGSSQCVSIGARRARGRGPPGALRPSPFDLWLGPHWTSLALWLLPSLPLAPSLFFLLFFFSPFDVDRQGQHLFPSSSFLFVSIFDVIDIRFFLAPTNLQLPPWPNHFRSIPQIQFSLLSLRENIDPVFLFVFFFFTLIIFLL